MRLRNKKTGEIVEPLSSGPIDLYFYLNKYEENEVDRKTYQSLSELNDEWEDYEPKEPLIKDEKIRKAVRAWVDLYGYKFVTHRFYSTTTGYRWSLLARETQEICLPELDGLDESKDYTIDELCGEEE